MGIERANAQFSTIQFGLSDSKYVQLVRCEMLKVRHEWLACQRGASATPKTHSPQGRRGYDSVVGFEDVRTARAFLDDFGSG
jgi:hypothetical protein